ncbi:MAG TPA: DUF721 domain-containing protein [Candidatus Edwardsbacteria bacterium]|nr:DUF721 domain-containing protein [Candidatus Edwardsbacteria bacterium]
MAKGQNGKRPERVGGILDRVLKDLELDKKIGENKAVVLWPEVVGAQLAAKTRAVSVSRGRLVVEVATSSLANDYRFLSPQIREKLNTALGAEVVKSITFRVGSWT